MKSICVKCKKEFYPEKNGVNVITYSKGEPIGIWSADLWKCPECGNEIIKGFGNAPIFYHSDDGFEESLKKLEGSKYTYKLKYD